MRTRGSWAVAFGAGLLFMAVLHVLLVPAHTAASPSLATAAARSAPHEFSAKQGWWARSEERAKRGTQWRESTLFFGLSLQDQNGTGDAEISDADFYRFVAQVVTPLFPDGLTILDAHGQYLNHHGMLVREKSKYMLIFHPDEPAYHDKLDQIWRNYTLQFQQESILLTSTITDFCFNDECLGTPIPDLQAEFESLQARHDHTAALLRDMEARLAKMEDHAASREWWWWLTGAFVALAGAALLVAAAVAYAGSRERWRRTRSASHPSAGGAQSADAHGPAGSTPTEERSPLLWH